MVVAGDFNNNVVWDARSRRPLNRQAAMVERLKELGVASAYHHARGVDQGQEPEPTLYWRDRRENGLRHHIDYVFAPGSWMGRIASVTVGAHADWVAARRHERPHLLVCQDLSSAAGLGLGTAEPPRLFPCVHGG